MITHGSEEPAAGRKAALKKGKRGTEEPRAGDFSCPAPGPPLRQGGGRGGPARGRHGGRGGGGLRALGPGHQTAVSRDRAAI